MLDYVTYNVIKCLTVFPNFFYNINTCIGSEGMVAKKIRKSLAVFPIGTVMEITGLTARQIRYYEEYNLIEPKRSETNRRLYSLNDIDRILDISDLMEEGMTLKGVQKKMIQNQMSQGKLNSPLTDADVRRILHDEMEAQNRFMNDVDLEQHL